MHQLRMFNRAGMDVFRQRWDDAKATNNHLYVSDMIDSPQYTVVLIDELVVEFVPFLSRHECGKYFFELLEAYVDALTSAGVEPTESRELWAWFTAVWAEWLQEGGRRESFLGEEARWFYKPGNKFRYYRHLLAGPFLIYSFNSDDPARAAIVLYNEVRKPNTLWVEHIGGRPEISTNKTLLSLITEQHFDRSRNKPFATSRYFANKKRTGNISRFGTVHSQLSRTFDFHSLEIRNIRSILPDEFDGWFTTNRSRRRGNSK